MTQQLRSTTREKSEKIFRKSEIFVSRYHPIMPVYLIFSESFRQSRVVRGGGGGGGTVLSDNLIEERPKGVEIFSVRPERRGHKNPDYNFLSMDL